MLERLPKDSACMEVGVLDGDFSEQILQRCNPSELHLVDLHTDRFERRFESEVACGRVIVRRGYSWEVLGSCTPGQFDWIYIDASHDYPSVKRDALAAADKVRREGMLIFNDYTYMCPNSFRKYGVIEAVNELCLEQDWELVYLCLQGRGFYDVAIRRIGEKTWPMSESRPRKSGVPSDQEGSES
jgi:hypothetical protein